MKKEIKFIKIKQALIIMFLAISFVMPACSQKTPAEIRTYRELFNYSVSAMQAYKDRPVEYVSLIKDAITILDKDLDENISKKGEVWNNLSDRKEIQKAVFVMSFALASVKDAKFYEKYKSIDEKSFVDVLEKAFLYKAGGNKTVQTASLWDGIERNNLEKVKACLNSGADINSKTGKYGYTPLIYAVKQNRVDMVELLLKAKPNLNVADSNGRCAIHYAASDGNWKIWELIANSGADVNVKDSASRTPLMYLEQDCLDRAELLVKLGANVDARTDTGYTMLINVCKSNYGPEWVKFLIKSGADVNAKANNGITALGAARDLSDKLRKFNDENYINCLETIALLRTAGAR